MKSRIAVRSQWIGIAALAFLTCGAAMASDIEWQIPLIRDTAGSGITMEFSRDGTRQTATPFFTLFDPTVQWLENRIGEKTVPWAAKELPPVPGEITLRSMKGFLKGLRSSLKEKPAPAVVVAGPELRLGRTDTSPR